MHIKFFILVSFLCFYINNLTSMDYEKACRLLSIVPQEKNESNQAFADRCKVSYRKFALEFHPDKNSHEEAEEKFKEINNAYHFLDNFFKNNIKPSNLSFQNNSTKDIFLDITRNIRDSFSHSDGLKAACHFLTTYYNQENFEENKFIRSLAAATAKCIKEMRSNADCINNPGSGFSNWIARVPKNHFENMYEARVKMSAILLGHTKESEACDLTSDDRGQIDWCKNVEEQTAALNILFSQRKEILDRMSTLYDEGRIFNSTEVQKNLKDLKLNHLEMYEKKYENVSKFFGWEKNCFADITSIANLHEGVEKIFSSKEK
ncbi:MAG: DnaJ domain-containing protein [Candidatus Chromulinivorax sp.]